MAADVARSPEGSRTCHPRQKGSHGVRNERVATETKTSIRVGGQALADGVFMRTERAWAIARADGTIETGPVPHNPVGAIPVLRVLVSLAVALRLGIVKGLAG